MNAPHEPFESEAAEFECGTDQPPVRDVSLSESSDADTGFGVPERQRGPRVRRAMGQRTRSLLSWAWVLTVAVTIALLMRLFIVAAFFIPSESMEPALQVGDRLLVSKLSYLIGEPSPGDIVVFGTPDQLQAAKTDELVKRVIAIGGQRVQAVNGLVVIDGSPVKEDYLPADVYTHEFGPVVVPKDHIFVMGDNRLSSQDSRFFGPVHKDELVGRVFVRFWPPNRLGGP